MHTSRILHVLPRFHDVRAPNILCTFESYVFSIWVWTMEQKTHTHTQRTKIKSSYFMCMLHSRMQCVTQENGIAQYCHS